MREDKMYGGYIHTPVNPDTGAVESKFREEIRDLLGLDTLARDQTIFNEIRLLKQRDSKTSVLRTVVEK